MPISGFRPSSGVRTANFGSYNLPNKGVWRGAGTDGEYLYLCGTARTLVRVPQGNSLEAVRELTPVTTLAVYAVGSNSTRLFIGAQNGGVEYSDDRGLSWTKAAGGLPSSNCFGIMASDDIILAQIGTGSTYWFSLDNGVNWASATFSASKINGAERFKKLPSGFYAATSFGPGAYQYSSNGLSFVGLNSGGSDFISAFAEVRGAIAFGHDNGEVYYNGALMPGPFDSNSGSFAKVRAMGQLNNRLYVGYQVNSGTACAIAFEKELGSLTLCTIGDHGESNPENMPFCIGFDDNVYAAVGDMLIRTFASE